MVREGAVNVREEFGHLAAEGLEEPGGDGAGDAVARIDRNAHWALEAHVGKDALEIGGHHVLTADRARHLGRAPVLVPDAGENALNLVGEERDAADHHLEAVVFGRIVRAGHGDARAVAEVDGGEVENGRRHHTNVDDVHACGSDALHQGAREPLARQAAVAADAERGPAGLVRHRAEHPADLADGILRQSLVNNAANVISLKNRGVGRHNFSPRISPQALERGLRLLQVIR